MSNNVHNCCGPDNTPVLLHPETSFAHTHDSRRMKRECQIIFFQFTYCSSCTQELAFCWFPSTLMKLMEFFFEPFSISLIVWLADVCRLIFPLSSQNAELELVVSVLQDPWLVTKFFAS
jgi:hypothetical protein